MKAQEMIIKAERGAVACALFAALSACGMAPTTDAKQLQQLKDQNLARLVARTSDGAFFSIGSEFDLGIKEVDGVSVQVNRHGQMQDKIDLTLAPGKHTLGIDCTVDTTQAMNGGPTTETSIEVDLMGGHVYEISTKGFSPETVTCAGIVTDVTDNVVRPGHRP